MYARRLFASSLIGSVTTLLVFLFMASLISRDGIESLRWPDH